jgi:outer membrane receptor for ferrienterochelin and colicin
VDKNLLDELPNGRSFLDAVSLLPGVAGLEEPFRRADDNHRHNFGEYSLFHVHGADCTDNVFLVDGLETTDTATGRSGLAIPWEAIQEIELVTGGMPAEYGRATGGIVNIVTRYGGNAFHGSLPVSFSGDGWHRSTDNGFRHGDHPDQPWEPSERDDFTELEWGGSLGGPVVRNHLWFFAAYDRFTRTIDDSNEYGNLFERTERFDEGLANLVWQINPDHKLKAQYAGSDGVWDSRDRYHSFYNDPTTWSRIESGGHLWQLKWTGIFTPDLFVETQVGRHENTWTDGPANAGFDDPRFWDSRGTYGSGILYGNVDEILDIHRPRDQYRATVNYFLDDRAGDHSFKAGVEYHDLEFETDLIYPDLYGINRAGGHPDYWEQGADINYLDTGKILTLFVQDKWWLNDDWIINAGLRLENQEQQNDVGEEVYSFDNLLSPRLGVVWDIHGDGRSNLFAHYGRYHDAVGLMLASALNRQVNRWYYYEGDYETGQWEEREEYRQVGDPNLNEVDPGLEPNVKDEIIVGYEFEFAGDFAARARLVCNRQSNMIEDVLANEYDIRYGNIFPHEYIRRFTNVQSARRDYRGLELVCEKQLSNNYQFLASATFSRAKGSVVYDDFHQGLGIRGVSVYADFAEMKENRYGSLPWDDAAYLKFAGSYHLPFGFIVGGTINWRSGRPYNRIDYWLPEGAEGFHGYGGQYFLEHRGYERLDSVWWIDLRLRKDFDIGPTTLSLTADAFNLTNNQDVIGVSEYYSSSGQYPISYGEPNTWMRAGYFVAGARFSF